MTQIDPSALPQDERTPDKMWVHSDVDAALPPVEGAHISHEASASIEPMYRSLPEVNTVQSGDVQPNVVHRTTLTERLRTFLPGKRGKLAQLQSLHRAIANYPGECANYAMRGELYLSIGEHALANADLYKALSLAREALAAARWGLVAQAVQDRAIVGLETIERLGLPERVVAAPIEEMNMLDNSSTHDETSANEIERRYATD